MVEFKLFFINQINSIPFLRLKGYKQVIRTLLHQSVIQNCRMPAQCLLRKTRAEQSESSFLSKKSCVTLCGFSLASTPAPGP